MRKWFPMPKINKKKYNISVYTALRIITNHTRLCWAYECNNQSESDEFSTCWLNYLMNFLSSETTKCKSMYDVSKMSTVQTASAIIMEVPLLRSLRCCDVTSPWGTPSVWWISEALIPSRQFIGQIALGSRVFKAGILLYPKKMVVYVRFWTCVIWTWSSQWTSSRC